jgi:aminoglycoside/choline kinase family phosphotransferase
MLLPPDVRQSVTEWLGPGWSSRALSGDASVRAYFRLTDGKGEAYILCWYPEEVRHQLECVSQARAAIGDHAPVPRILHVSESAMLQEDAGEVTLLSVLQADPRRGSELYARAIDVLVEFQKGRDPAIHPPFSADFFMEELEMAREYYVERLMDWRGANVAPLLTGISEIVVEHPYRICHRDYHGENIHIKNNHLFVLDYQDMRPGPDTYDAASLLRDRGVASMLGERAEMELLDRYVRLAGLEGNVRQRYFEVLLQRSIKILGTFARQAITRGRLHYLDHIPSALSSIERCLDELPELNGLRDIFPLRFSLEAARDRARELNTA